MGEDHEMLYYRVDKLEKAFEEQVDFNGVMKDFMTEVKVYMRVIAFFLGILALAGAGILVKLLIG